MLDTIKHGRLRWFIIAFCLSGFVMTLMLAWQLYETTPARWCVMTDRAEGCVAILMKLLEIKDHTVMGLLIIVGLSVLCLAAVALGLRLGVSGPGGIEANIGVEVTSSKD